MEDGGLYAIDPADLQEVLTELPDAVVVTNSEHPEGVFSAPLKVQIQTTKICNLKCGTCAVFGGECNTAAQMSNKQIFGLVEQLASMGVLNIEWSGGEPLLRKDFWAFVQHAADLGLSQNLLTNGTCFSSKNAVLLSSFYRIQISLDGIGETFNRIVGRNAWNAFLRSMDSIQNMGLNIVMGTVLQRENVDHLDEIVEFCSIHNLPKLRISLQIPIGRSVSISWREYSQIIDRFREQLPLLKKKAMESNVELDVFLEKVACNDDTVVDVSRIVSPGGYSFLYVDAIGDIYPFPFLTQPAFRLGSCISDDLRTIWLRSTILSSIRQQTYQNTGCGECRYECAFAERSLVLGFTGRIDRPAMPHRECTKRKEVMPSCQK
jgi:MoaA/NifB/PqqE/SkfB family radical SAM enzyme